METEKSERALLAERLAALIREKRMTAPFGGDVERGKRSYDKRQALAEKQSKREMQRALSRRSSGKDA